MLLELLAESGPHEFKDPRRDLDASVEFFDLPFEPRHWDGAHLALGALGEPPIADEVLILDSLVVGGLLENEPGAAVSTPDGRLKEVVVLALTLTLPAAT